MSERNVTPDWWADLGHWEHPDRTTCPNMEDTHICSEHGKWTRWATPDNPDPWATARNAVPDLLAEVERLRAALAEAEREQDRQHARALRAEARAGQAEAALTEQTERAEWAIEKGINWRNRAEQAERAARYDDLGHARAAGEAYKQRAERAERERAARDEGIRQAIDWLRADYEYGTGPDWRERGAEWIAERAAEDRIARDHTEGGDHD